MITLDPASPTSPAEQIRSQLEALIRTGQLAEDTRLPTVRQLAADLRVAAGTVAKAYKELESVGLIRTGRAAGTRVNSGFVTASPVLNAAQVFTRLAIDAGLSLDEAQGIVATGWNSHYGN
ncbi:GntR family transcriptional regulator [Arthrobacter sp. SDTb3-6]|uniref:GntR family transcriptional regulator n=1 Tax=Arthrobacter sp. SDTb3-6 TaxID=2713571 RepID=UPI00159DA079|nr:GntR family transcriptional regulator [Arthrobacter sp. SDTb3-6]